MKVRHGAAAATLVLSAFAGGAAPPPAAPSGLHDVVIRGGTVYDGTGGGPVVADVAIDADRITAIEAAVPGRGRTEIEAKGMAVAPGFVNMLSWADEALLIDGRGLSDLKQGVTLEVFGEGWSDGPLNEAMRKEALEQQGDLRHPVDWTTLGEFLETLERRGVSMNVASFVGATTVRIHELGYADRPPTPEELERMKALVARAMDEGALGLGASLIYAPAFYAKTDELVELAKVAASRGGTYIAHIRSEGSRFLEAVDETLEICRRAGLPVEFYHFKAAGRENWDKLDRAIAKIEAARAAGQRVTADMYVYTAGATGLDASMPPWVQEGGLEAWIGRLRDPATRERVRAEMRTPSERWENLFLAAGGPENILLVGFKNPALKPLTGKTLAQVAAERGRSPEDTAMDLVVEDGSRVETIYFLMSEDNVRKEIALPWMSFGSDAEASAPEGVFLGWMPHPRAYGNVARLLGKYVRDEKIIPLEEAIRRLAALPASNLGLEDRGRLAPGAFADVVVFDPATIADHATYQDPRRLATGVRDVLVNGRLALRNGEPTDCRPGRVVRGKGYSRLRAPRTGP